MASKRVQLTITDQRFFDDAQNKREAVRVWSLPWKLPYWIEKWDAQNEQAKVWVKVPKIPANGSVDVYLYYGNSEAVSESDPEQVFDLYDDFEGGVLDTNKWIDTGFTTVTVENSVLKIQGKTGGVGAPIAVISKKEFNDYVLECLVAHDTDDRLGDIVFWALDDNNKVYIQHETRTGGYDEDVKERVGGTFYTIADYRKEWGVNEWVLYTISVHSNKFKITRGEQDIPELEETRGLQTTNRKIAFSGDYEPGNFMVDWVRVRKYAEQEPTVVVGEEEASDISGWLYRRKITITNPNSYDLEHFQVAIDLDGSNFDFIKANTDGSDIRITYASARYRLPYYIETWDTSTPQAVIWVGIDSETRFFVELDPNNTTDESDPTVMDLPEATNYTLAKFERYVGGG